MILNLAWYETLKCVICKEGQIKMENLNTKRVIFRSVVKEYPIYVKIALYILKWPLYIGIYITAMKKFIYNSI